MTTPQTAQQDYAKVAFNMYCDALQHWNKAYDGASHALQNANGAHRANGRLSESQNTEPKSIGAQLFRRAVESQMARCRFFERRWSNYLGLPDALASCKSPLDLLPLQASFLKQAIEDYTMESAKMMQAFMPWLPQNSAVQSR